MVTGWKYNRPGGEAVPLTICVAAICFDSMIIGASDRMLTAGDIQFEPQQMKVEVLTSSIAVLVAGDSALQAEILQNVRLDVQERVEKEPTNWWNVRDVADLYRRYYSQARLRRSENTILSPFGLDSNSFIGRQKEMDAGFIRQIATEMINFDTQGVAAIICGVDTTGPHIYLAQNSDITCQDAVGFSAIGAGSWHASSQFMFAGHTRSKGLADTLLLAYSAKKRAEVAPGVGEATDMFIIGPGLGTYNPLAEPIQATLDTIYKDSQKRIRRESQKAQDRVNQYVQEIIGAATAKDQTAGPEEDGSGNAPVDKKELRDGTQESEPTT